MKRIFRKVFNKTDNDRFEFLRVQQIELKNKIKILKEKNDFLEKINQRLEQELLFDKEKNQKLKSQIEALKNITSPSKIKELYNNLSETTKKGLKNIFKDGNNELKLFASCIEKFDSLWEYAKYLNNQHKDKDFKILKEMLKTIFPYIESVKRYELLNIKIGDRFDIDLVVRDNRSIAQDGVIKDILLFGYSKRGRVIKKAVVRI